MFLTYILSHTKGGSFGLSMQRVCFILQGFQCIFNLFSNNMSVSNLCLFFNYFDSLLLTYVYCTHLMLRALKLSPKVQNIKRYSQ